MLFRPCSVAAPQERVRQLALEGWEGASGHPLQAWAAGEVPSLTTAPGVSATGPGSQGGAPAGATVSRWAQLTGVTWASSSWSAWGF